MRQLHCTDEMLFAFSHPPVNFLLSNELICWFMLKSTPFLHFDVWSISSKIYEKPQGQSGIICYLHCSCKTRHSVLVFLNIKAGSFSWNSTKWPRFSVLIQNHTNPKVVLILPFSSGSKQSRKCPHDNTLYYFGPRRKTTLTFSTVTLTQKL